MIFHLVGNMFGCITDRVWHSRIVGNIVWFIILLAWRYDDFWPTPVLDHVILFICIYMFKCMYILFCGHFVGVYYFTFDLCECKATGLNMTERSTVTGAEEIGRTFSAGRAVLGRLSLFPTLPSQEYHRFPFKNIYIYLYYIHYKMDTRPESFIYSTCFLLQLEICCFT